MKKNKFIKTMEFFSVAFVAGVMLSMFFGVKSQTSSRDNLQTEEAVLSIDSETLMTVAEEYSDVEEVTGIEKEALLKKIDDVYNSDLTELEMKEALKALGEVFLYEDEVEYVSASSDITLNKPTISYNSSTKYYTVKGTGSLPSSAIKEDFSDTVVFAPKVYSTKNIGGVDGVALYINNATGYSSGLAIVNGYGMLNGNPTGGNSTSSTMVTSNDRYGVGYEVQDKIYYTDVKNYVFVYSYTYQYNAGSITCKATYNNKFATYDGDLKLCYSHTWDKTEVNSIGVSTDGISFGWSENSDKWTAYSKTRTFENGKQTN